jgi:predicted phosphodiesterase
MELSPVEAWTRTVDFALEEDVAAVVLAGDVVDNDRDRFEAYGHLERGIQQLSKAGIRVVAVAGNHDGIVLPRLAKNLAHSGFELLGTDAHWQRLELPGEPPVDIIGWSFPTKHWKDNPLNSPGLEEVLDERRADAALLAVVHADLDVGASSYAPVASKDLHERGDVDGWFLGHIHQPHDLQGERPIGYLGSLVGLDRSETGPRGPWLVTVEGRGKVRARQVPLGPVQWERTEIDVTDLPTEEHAAEDFLRDAVHNRFREMRQDRVALAEPALRVVAVSIVFVGQPDESQEVRKYVQDCTPDKLRFHFDDQVWTAAKLENGTRLRVNLTQLREQRTPLGLAAEIVHILETGGDLPVELSELVTEASTPFTEGAWSLDSEHWPFPSDRSLLLAAARNLLDVLLAQHKSAVAL